MKRAKAEFRKIIFFVLSIVMFFTLISIPKTAEAKTYYEGDWTAGQVFFPGDVIGTPPENQWMEIRYGFSTSDEWFPFNEEAWGGTGDSYYFQYGGFYEAYASGSSERVYHKAFTFPERPDRVPDDVSSIVYIARTDFLKLGSFDTFLMDTYGYPIKDKKVRGLDVYAYRGCAVEFYNNNGSRILEDYIFCIFRDGPSVGCSGQINPANYPLLDGIIGWSTNPNYMNSPATDDVFIPASKGDRFTVPSDLNIFEAMYNKANNGSLKLYPVYYKDTALSVSISDCTEDETLNYSITSNRPSGRDNYSVEFRKFITSDETVAVSGVPSEPGQYRIIVRMDKESLSYNDSGSNLNYIPYSDAYTDSDFTISPTHDASVTKAPVGLNLDYNGSLQDLIVPGTAYDGEMVYSFTESGTYSNAIPAKKEAGKYTIWYKAKGINRPDSATAKVEATINPIKVGLEWSENEFIYDGEEHCPSVNLTGLLAGDDCQATVTGAQKNVGTYTATVSQLSNSNYSLPSIIDKTFTISPASSTVYIAPGENDLTYNGKEQELISAGSADGGTVVYSLSKDGTYSSELPKGKNSQEYTVWYKSIGDSNHTDSTANSINIRIKPATVGLEWSEDEFIFDGEEHCPNAFATGLFEGDECEVTVSGAKKEAGTFTAKAVMLSNSNYTLPNDTENTFTVLPTGSSIKTYPTANELIYNGNNQELLTTGETKDGEMVYSLSENGTYSSEIPLGKEAKVYTVWFKIIGDSNHTDSEKDNIKVIIKPKTVDLEWSDTEIKYDRKEHCPTAKITNLCGDDICEVKVSGGETEKGIYTATATELSNKNYKLPKNNTTEFKIFDPEKLKGEVTISMTGYIYGGKAATPKITSKTNDVSKPSILYKRIGSSDNSYSATVPSDAGDYIVKVILPEDKEYNACSATAEFSISYLPVPENSYTISGETGENGWYVSDVTITPAVGYEISYGDRNHFSGNPIRLEDTVSVCYIFIKDTLTGEQTSMISVGNFKIDCDAPDVIGMENNGLYFADESGRVKVLVKDENISKVMIGDEEVKLSKAENGSMSFVITVGRKKEKTSFTIYDAAGNMTDFAVITAPYWASTGEVIEGDLYLEGNEKYTLPDGTWAVSGDGTRYSGGIVFYVVSEGDYTLQKIN